MRTVAENRRSYDFFFTSAVAAEQWVHLLRKLYDPLSVRCDVGPCSDDPLKTCVEVTACEKVLDQVDAAYLAWGEGYLHGKAEVMAKIECLIQ